MLKPILRPILKSILQPVLIASTDLTRWVWTLNGMSYGISPAMDLNATSAYKNTFLLPALPVSTVKLFESDDSLSYLSLSSAGVLSITGNITAKINGSSVVSGITLVAIDEVILLEITPTAEMSVSNYPASTLLPTIKNHGVVVTGILNTAVFASGTANYKFLEPYSDSHIAVDSDNPDGEELWILGVMIVEGVLAENVNLDAALTYRIDTDSDVAVTLLGANPSITLNVGSNTTFVTGVTSVAVKVADSSGTTVSVKQTTAMQKFNDLPEDYSEASL